MHLCTGLFISTWREFLVLSLFQVVSPFWVILHGACFADQPPEGSCGVAEWPRARGQRGVYGAALPGGGIGATATDNGYQRLSRPRRFLLFCAVSLSSPPRLHVSCFATGSATLTAHQTQRARHSVLATATASHSQPQPAMPAMPSHHARHNVTTRTRTMTVASGIDWSQSVSNFLYLHLRILFSICIIYLS